MTILCCSRCFNGTILGLGHGDCVVDCLSVVDSVGLHSVEVIADNGNNYFVAIAGLNNFLYKVSMLADESGINVAVGDSLAVSKLEVVLIHILCEALKGSALNGDASDSGVINQGDVVDVEYVSFSATARCGVGRESNKQRLTSDVIIYVIKRYREFCPITRGDIVDILGCSKLVGVSSVLWVLIVGAVGDYCTHRCSIGSAFWHKFRPESDAVGATMHHSVEWVTIGICIGVADVHSAAVSRVVGSGAACIQAASSHGAISNHSKKTSRSHYHTLAAAVTFGT